MTPYLESSEFIDSENVIIKEKAADLTSGHTNERDIVKSCFEFVRDEIKHSWDYKMNPVTLKASDVLIHQTGYCYAKSHLLAALLRANKIPAALCYQRLKLEANSPSFCLHGLNSVYLKDYGWIRIDARGNKNNINALFKPPHEILAFNTNSHGEKNFNSRHYKPVQEVIHTLSNHSDIQSVYENLPDIHL